MSQSRERPSPAPPLDPVVEAYKPGVDRTLLRANLRRTPDERLRNLVALQRFADELRRGGARLSEQE